MSNTPFRIDVLDANGDKLGDGPLINVLQMNTVSTLDKIGKASFVVPINDPRARLIAPGCQFDFFDAMDGYVGRFLYESHSLTETDGRGLITVNCWDNLKALTRQIVGFRREYAFENIDEIILDILSDFPDWSLDSNSLQAANVTYQGQTAFAAIEELIKRWGYHFRLSPSNPFELELGSFGSNILGLRFVNLDGQDSSLDDAIEIGILKGIRQKTNDDDVYNRIIALGAGTGKSQLQLKDGETGDTYTVQNRTRANGDEEFYIEDSASITAYGARELVLIFDQIRPIANTVTAKNQAKSELLRNAEIFLERHKEPRTQLDNVTVYNLRQPVLLGEKVFVRYKSLDDNGSFSVDVEGYFWVLQHSRTRNAQGQYLSTFQLGSIDRIEKTDMDIITDTVKGMRSEKLWIKPVPFRFSDTYTDTVQNSNGDYQDKTAKFTFTIDETVTEVTRVLIEFRTKPLYTTAIWGAISPTNTLPASPTDPHSHALDLTNTGTDGVFTVVTADNYPTDLSLELNGVNIDNDIDVDYIDGGNGPWNNGGTPNAALFVRMDITDLILNDAGGIYQTFEFEFILNAPRTRDCAVPYWSVVNPVNNQIYGNQGIIEFKVITQGVAQAIP